MRESWQLYMRWKSFAYFIPDFTPTAVYGIFAGTVVRAKFFGHLSFLLPLAETHHLVFLCFLLASSSSVKHIRCSLPHPFDILACATNISVDGFSGFAVDWVQSQRSLATVLPRVLMQAPESLSYCICLCKLTACPKMRNREVWSPIYHWIVSKHLNLSLRQRIGRVDVYLRISVKHTMFDTVGMMRKQVLSTDSLLEKHQKYAHEGNR